MDPRQSLSRTTSSTVPQQGTYTPTNMASAYAMPSYQNTTHLPPINYSPLPPTNQNYMSQQQYRPDLPRYTSAPTTASAPTQTPDTRYSSHMGPQGPMGGLPPASMLPQPHNQAPQAQNYPAQQPPRQSYPQPLAPAPPRPSLDTLSTSYAPPDNRQPAWSGADTVPGMTSEVGRDPTRTHVVGSQGRRGILPSAPGRAPVMPNGVNGSPKGNAIPAKDADGKFPCPNCTKTYLHAKHLKRHMLRHTGDRPYMCVLCNDTFSRSDILKRHFQKCSVRRGNPTGASHLSNPAAHLKKSQAVAKAATNSPASATTPSSAGMANVPFTTTAMPNTLTPTTAGGPPTSNMAFAMQPNGQSDMQPRPGPGQPLPGNPGQSAMDPNAGNSWQMHSAAAAAAARNNQMMYHNTSTPPDHFGMQPGTGEDKRNVMSGSHHMGDEWPQMFPPGANEGYMNPMFTGYDQSQNDVKKDYDTHEGGSNGYYIPSTSLGADGTLGPPLWNLNPPREDLFQAKVDALLTFVFPGGIQESLQEQQNNLLIRPCLTVDAIRHFLHLFPNFQGHFPWLHLPTFNLLDAYDGLVLVIICSGAVYSDRVSQGQVRALMQRVKDGIGRTSRILKDTEAGAPPQAPPVSASGAELDELLALLMIHSLLMWHGGPDERATARAESTRVLYLVRRFNMLTLAPPHDPTAYSYLHHLAPGEQADPSLWDWRIWLEQEKRSRLAFLAFLWQAALCIYFNVPPQISPSEIKLPLPCDDAAWEAPDAETCAQALGLRGVVAQGRVNLSGSLRVKQLGMHHAVSALHSPAVVIQPRTTNVYSKFILIHALHTEIWQVQRQRSWASSPSVSPLGGGNTASGPVAQANILYQSINTALTRWKQCWDEDYALQYLSRSAGFDPPAPKRVGFCRDGVHFYWLACAFMQPNRLHDWQLPADARFRMTMNGLKKAREWSRSDGAQRGEEPGSIADMDDDYASEALEQDMRKLFRPLTAIWGSPITGIPTIGMGYR